MFIRLLASLVAQSVKNLPAMQKTQVRFLGLEDPVEKEMANHSSILAWRIPWTVHWVAKSQTRLSDFHFLSVYTWASLIAQSVKNLPAIEGIRRGSLVGCCLWGRTESDTTEAT